jgi:hypothetical protein
MGIPEKKCTIKDVASAQKIKSVKKLLGGARNVTKHHLFLPENVLKSFTVQFCKRFHFF